MFEQKEYLYALPISQKVNGINNIIGTATCIIPGVFMTAKHVVEEWNKRTSLKAEMYEGANYNANYYVDALHFHSITQNPIVWHMNKVHMDINGDLALLIGERVSGRKAELMLSGNIRTIIDLHLPKINDRIISIGFPQTTNVHIDGDITNHSLRMHRYEGIVTEISPDGYNLVKNFCFQTNSVLIQGMSGGPCFNSKGELIGINNSSFDATEEFPEPITTISPISVMFSQIITVALEGYTELQTITLFDMCKNGYIIAKGIDHFQITDSGWKYDMKLRCKDCE